jgi:hypothetical protein
LEPFDMTVDPALFTFAHDIVDEGTETVVANIADRIGSALRT